MATKSKPTPTVMTSPKGTKVTVSSESVEDFKARGYTTTSAKRSSD